MPEKKDQKFKLNKIKKAGIAVGLTFAIAATTLTGCVSQMMHNAGWGRTTQSSPTPQTSYTQEYEPEEIQAPSYLEQSTNELKTYTDSNDYIPIIMSDIEYMHMLDILSDNSNEFKMSQYYGLDETLSVYESTTINKETMSPLLDSQGKLDAQKLVEQVLANNSLHTQGKRNDLNIFYTEMSRSDIDNICRLIAEVVNNEYNDIDIRKVANTLTELTMFERSGSASNAYITESLTFVFNPKMSEMYANSKKMQGVEEDKDTIVKSVIVHEIMHLLEYSASDNKSENGLEAGICRKYNTDSDNPKVQVDSLWNTWLLEAGAELGMSDYMNIEPGTYEKKISYVKSYNLSRFNDLDIEHNGLEDVVYDHTLEEAYQDLNLDTPEKQREFLNFLYSVEITQTDPEEFWESYKNATGEDPTEEEKTEIRMEIRSGAVKFLTRNFYTNLVDSIHEGKISDLNSAFYLIRNYELDAYNHLKYTSEDSKDPAIDFVIWNNDIQQELFNSIAQSTNTSVDDIKTAYDNFYMQSEINKEIYDNVDLSKYSTYTQDYIKSTKKDYTTMDFVRIGRMADALSDTTTLQEQAYVEDTDNKAKN